MKQRESHRLKNNWAYAQKVWLEKKSRYKLKGWVLRATFMDKIGLCDYSNKTIHLSTVFMRGANCNYKKVKRSLLHEVAHALTPGHGHNQTWKQMCRRIGGDDRLSASMDLPGMDWAMYCRKCGWRQEMTKKPDVRNKVCMGCNQQPRVKYIH